MKSQIKLSELIAQHGFEFNPLNTVRQDASGAGIRIVHPKHDNASSAFWNMGVQLLPTQITSEVFFLQPRVYGMPDTMTPIQLEFWTNALCAVDRMNKNIVVQAWLKDYFVPQYA